MWYSGHPSCRRQCGERRGKTHSGKEGSSCCGGSGREKHALDGPEGFECIQRMAQTAGKHQKQAANATKEQVSQRQEFIAQILLHRFLRRNACALLTKIN